MSQSLSKKGFYHGWWIVITGLFLMAILFAAVISLPGLFTIFVTEEFGVTRTAFTTHITILTLTSIVAALFVGKVFQKYNIKLLMTIFTLVSVAGFLGYSFATQLWHFYAISAILGFCLMFLTSVPISILINNWFGPKMKGKAMGIAMTGSGIGAMILNPVISFINNTYGWRMSYRLLAFLTLVIVLPLVALKVSRYPAEKGVDRLGDDPNATAATGATAGLSVKQALGSNIFWIMFFTFFLFSLTTTVFNVNAVPYMTDIGINPVTAGTFMSLSSLGVIIGKLALGGISDKWSVKVASSSAIIFLIIGLVLFLGLPKMLVLAPVATFVFGLGNANATVTMPLITGEMVGNRDYGAIFGYANIASSLGASVGPLLGAMIFDVSGSYAAAWGSDIALIVVMLLTLHLCYRLKPGAWETIADKETARA